MSTTASYQIETLTQTALIIGSSQLASQTRSKLEDVGVQTFHSIDQLKQQQDLDYLLIFPSPDSSQASKLLQLFNKYKPRAYCLTHYSSLSQIPDKLSSMPKIAYGDFLGDEYMIAPTLENYLQLAHSNQAITLPGDGLQPYHLITIDDLVSAIYNQLTTTSTQDDIFIVGQGSISLISLAYKIRSGIGKNITLDFDPDKDWSDSISESFIKTRAIKSDFSSLLSQTISSYTPSQQSPTTQAPAHQQKSTPVSVHNRPSKLSNLKQEMSSTSAPTSLEQPVFVPASSPRHRLTLPKIKLKNPFKRHAKGSSSKPSKGKILISGLIIAIAIYLSAIMGSLTITILTLKNYQGLLTDNTLPSTSSLKTARIPAVFLEANFVAINTLLRDGVSSVSAVTSLFSSYRQSLEMLVLAHDLTSTTSELLGYVLGNNHQDPTSLINLARLQSDELYEALSLLGASLPTRPPDILPSKYQDSYQSLKQALSTIRKHTLTAKSLFSISPDLLGIGDRRKYLVLFQNNMELRPTGGFIGSFAIISLENGVLYDMPIYDVYSADGQLKGHVEPPIEIKEYLGEANWYLRDSNWDPDFPTSARRAQWFLGKTMGTEVQGTIAINVYTLANLLDAVGSLDLPDYQEQVNSSNIFERAEYYSEVNFFPGSTQKKEFLSSVADALFAKLSDLTQDQSYLLARALALSIDEKNTLFSLDSRVGSHTLNVLGWDGEIRNDPCPDLQGTCTSDYAMLVDSNLGVNKANYFLRRTLQLNLNIDKDRVISHKLEVNYQNTSTSTAWPAGVYKSYSRLYLPLNTVLDEIIINGKKLAQDKITTTQEHDRLVIGYLLEVPISSSVKVQYQYRLDSALSDNSPIYSFYWQKQPGTAADPLKIYLNYPLYLEPTIISPQATINAQQLEFNLTNTTDRRITVKFK